MFFWSEGVGEMMSLEDFLFNFYYLNVAIIFMSFWMSRNLICILSKSRFYLRFENFIEFVKLVSRFEWLIFLRLSVLRTSCHHQLFEIPQHKSIILNDLFGVAINVPTQIFSWHIFDKFQSFPIQSQFDQVIADDKLWFLLCKKLV